MAIARKKPPVERKANASATAFMVSATVLALSRQEAGAALLHPSVRPSDYRPLLLWDHAALDQFIDDLIGDNRDEFVAHPGIGFQHLHGFFLCG